MNALPLLFKIIHQRGELNLQRTVFGGILFLQRMSLQCLLVSETFLASNYKMYFGQLQDLAELIITSNYAMIIFAKQ